MAKYKAGPRVDLYQTVTDQIIALLEQGVRPWARSWSGDDVAMRPLRHNGQPYHGINVLILWMTALEKSYASPFWMTYDQAIIYGGQVRKGEKSTKIIFISVQVTKAGTIEEERYPVLRSYSVFNTAQIDGLPEKFTPKPIAAASVANERNAQADAFFNAIPVDLRHGGNRAFYSPSEDFVQLPEFSAFHNAEAYYTVKGHEYVHWTKHSSRLDRAFNQARWGDEGYAAEELVAELGAAYLAADLALTLHPREDHASYITHWLKVLKNDKRAIFTAATAAEKAVSYLHGIVSPQAVVSEDDEPQRVSLAA